MGNIVFARTRYQYDSYTDFWKLVALSKYPTVYVDEIDPDSPATYIATPFNGEFFPLGDYKKRRAKIVLWNLERPSASKGVAQYHSDLRGHVEDRYLDGVIVSDTKLAKETGFNYIPLGSHPELGAPGSKKKYGYVHLMCYSNRRSFLFKTPSEPKSVITGIPIAPNGWGDQRHESLQSSWFMLNVHQDDDLYMEPLRFALAAAYGLTVISENLYGDPYPYQLGTIKFPIGSLQASLRTAFNNRIELSDMGSKMRRYVMTYHTFRKCIERYFSA